MSLASDLFGSSSGSESGHRPATAAAVPDTASPVFDFETESEADEDEPSDADAPATTVDPMDLSDLPVEFVIPGTFTNNEVPIVGGRLVDAGHVVLVADSADFELDLALVNPGRSLRTRVNRNTIKRSRTLIAGRCICAATRELWRLFFYEPDLLTAISRDFQLEVTKLRRSDLAVRRSIIALTRRARRRTARVAARAQAPANRVP